MKEGYHAFPPFPSLKEPVTARWEGKENAAEMEFDPGMKAFNAQTVSGKPNPAMTSVSAPLALGQPSSNDPWWSRIMRSSPDEFQVFVEEEFGDGAQETAFDGNMKAPRLLKAKPKRAATLRFKKKGFRQGLISKLALGTKDSGRRRRKDLPRSKKHASNGDKPCLTKAIELAKCSKRAMECIKSVERDYFANSSRNAKEAKLKAVTDILTTAFSSAFPLTPKKLKLVAGVLREAGYKSADTYLVESKTAHVEKGHDWTPLLDRHFKLCIKAVKRGQGPRRKAPEVPRSVWSNYDLLATEFEGTKVLLAPHLFAMGVHFMMREIEIANLTLSDVHLDHHARLVKLKWSESKMDQEGLSISRTLQCICSNGCDFECPFAVTEVLVNAAMLRGSDGSLSVNEDGKVATKTELVRDWKHLFGIPVTGHSTRRSGALQYIRQGWAVPQVGYLGRWKSSVILQYAEEALETMAANTPGKFGQPTEGPNKPGTLANLLNPDGITVNKADLDHIVDQIKADIAKLKKGTKVSAKEFDDAVNEVKNKMESDHRYLPRYVVSGRYHVTHLNHKILLYAPAAQWRTVCGWHYYNSSYQFTDGEGTMVSCSKCQGIAQGKEVADGDPAQFSRAAG